ncbi:MAG: hypothetical protein F7B60_05275 [Desulfurococcales archaeon]|nr:hypothetical protein [Desulfurococcales archaeon]
MKISLSIPLLGLNWKRTTNPYLVIPVNQVLLVDYSVCEGKSKTKLELNKHIPVLKELLQKTVNKLTQVYTYLSIKNDKGLCLNINLSESSYTPLVSLYTASTLSAIYVMLREVLNGKPGVNDIIDIASYIWSREKPGVRMLYEALMISAIKRKPILYRGSEEHIVLDEFLLDKIAEGRYIPLLDANERDFDPQLESALVKLEGISIISAVNTLASKVNSPSFEISVLRDFFKVDNAISYILYNLPVPQENCKYIQSIEGYLEEICVDKA